MTAHQQHDSASTACAVLLHSWWHYHNSVGLDQSHIKSHITSLARSPILSVVIVLSCMCLQHLHLLKLFFWLSFALKCSLLLAGKSCAHVQATAVCEHVGVVARV